MLRGKIIGQVWSTRKIDSISSQKMVIVAELNSENIETGKVVISFDTLDSRDGDIVAVSYGSGARNIFLTGKNRHLMVDACVSMIIEGLE